jgi:methionyl-tRNA synthetase
MSISRRIFITTSIPYVNARPHVGYAWELVLADTFARYFRLAGNDVRFLTGTDDNSLKNVHAAERAGLATADFVRTQGQRYRELARRLNLSNDDFIQTAFDPRHAPAVQRLWQRCRARGDIYTKSYSGLYCVGCEQFLSSTELSSGRCPDHDAPLEHVEEENYFFRLSAHAPNLERSLTRGELRIHPEHYRAEVARWLERGLLDFSISRSAARARGWGIRVPDDPSQVVYVWFDALANYVSALDYARSGELFRDYWQESARRIHVIGKNVTRFHNIYWPAILGSAGAACPTDVVVHGFLTHEGRKIGKSLGNSVDPLPLIDELGADALRYYLLRRFPLDRDGDFSVAGLVGSCNADLADQLGNLQSRTLALLDKYHGGTVPGVGDDASGLAALGERAAAESESALLRFAPNEALGAVLAFVEAVNRYLAQKEPWALARALASAAGTERAAKEHALAAVLGESVRALLWAAGLLAPFIPESSQHIAVGFASPLPNPYQRDSRWNSATPGALVRRGEVLFRKRVVNVRAAGDLPTPKPAGLETGQ